MFDFFKKFLNFLMESKLTVKEDKATENNFFPIYSREDYLKQKKEIQDKAYRESIFFEAINTDIFYNNLMFFQKKECPYCGENITIKKSNSFKCPYCQNKIFKNSDLFSNFDCLFTLEQKETRNKLKKEVSKRKSFFKSIETQSIAPIIKNISFSDDKEENINILIDSILNNKKYATEVTKLSEYRMSNFFLAEIITLFKGNEMALKAWFRVIYIDMFGFYNPLYDEKDEYTKEQEKHYENLMQNEKFKQEHDNCMRILGFEPKPFDVEKHRSYYKEQREKSALEFTNVGIQSIAPYCYKQVKSLKDTFSNLENLFLESAFFVKEQLKYNVPITPQEAWEQFKTTI